jgi:hypothetical protein
VAPRYFEGEIFQDGGYDNRRFLKSKRGANTSSWPDSKRHVSKAVDLIGSAIQEASRIEMIGPVP